MALSTGIEGRTDIRTALRLQEIIEQAAVVGVEEALRLHGANLTATERSLLSGLSESEVAELQNTVQQLGDPDCVAMDNNF
jgi:hypothetical protein